MSDLNDVVAFIGQSTGDMFLNAREWEKVREYVGELEAELTAARKERDHYKRALHHVIRVHGAMPPERMGECAILRRALAATEEDG